MSIEEPTISRVYTFLFAMRRAILMGNKSLMTLMIGALVMLAGCATVPNEITFLEDALVSYKRALVSAQERIVLEEFAKYHIWGQATVALYRLETVTLEPQTKLTRGSKTSMGAELSTSATPTGKLAASREVIVANDQGGKISVLIKPLANAMNERAQEYFKTTVPSEIYSLTWYDETSETSYETFGGGTVVKDSKNSPCGNPYTFLHCVAISGYIQNKRQAYAQVPNDKIVNFRQMLRELRRKVDGEINITS
jgi:hypothetical protein